MGISTEVSGLTFACLPASSSSLRPRTRRSTYSSLLHHTRLWLRPIKDLQ